MVLDAALAVGKPFLPLPFTGGDSREYWDDYKDQICKWFGIPTEVAAQLESIDLPHCTEAETRRVADKIAEILSTAIERVCLLALPFHERYRAFYEEVF